MAFLRLYTHPRTLIWQQIKFIYVMIRISQSQKHNYCPTNSPKVKYIHFPVIKEETIKTANPHIWEAGSSKRLN